MATQENGHECDLDPFEVSTHFLQPTLSE